MPSRRVVLFTLVAAILMAPAAQAGKRKSVYVDPKKVTDTGTRYSDTDLRLLTQRMIESMLTSELEGPEGLQGGKPVIAMGRLENRTTQEVDVKLILETIEVGVLKSKAAHFVNRTESFRRNMADEDALVQAIGDGSGPTRQLVSYQYLLEGAITEIVSEDRKSRYYKLALTLTDIRSTVKVWAEEQELKKQR